MDHQQQQQQQLFIKAVEQADVAAVSELLHDNPNINLNHKDENGWTVLHVACCHGYDSIVSLLLRQPNIDVNCYTNYYETPLYLACFSSHPEIVKLLLNRSDIDVNITDSEDYSPLEETCDSRRLPCLQLLLADPRVEFATKGKKVNNYLLHRLVNGHLLDVLKWLIAIRGEHRLGFPKSIYDKVLTQAQTKDSDCVRLLDDYYHNHNQVRFRLRMELGFKMQYIVDLYSLVIFLCDGLLTLKTTTNTTTTAAAAATAVVVDLQPQQQQPRQQRQLPQLQVQSSTPQKLQLLNFQQQLQTSPSVGGSQQDDKLASDLKAIRYFNIVSQLPMELQMLLCHRVFASADNNITTSEAELGFRRLASSLQQGRDTKST